METGNGWRKFWLQSEAALFGKSLLLYLLSFVSYLVGGIVADAAKLTDNLWVTLAVLLLVVIGSAIFLTATFLFCVALIRVALSGTRFVQWTELASKADELHELLRSINDRLLISEVAKRIAFREKDRQALRNGIREDIKKGDFDAALALVEQLSKTYGYQSEAEEFRVQIQSARAAETEAKVTEAIGRLDRIIADHDWDSASVEAAKIQRVFPDSPRARALNRRIAEAREAHKRELEQQFLRAAERDEVDRAMELLRELDLYLTEQEAEPLRETARGVIGKKRDNLGVQFKLAIHDKDWLRAVRAGEQIIREFPNTKMANEVRGMLDLLRERAAGQRAAQV